MRTVVTCLVACITLVACAQQPVVSQTDPARPSTAQPSPAPKAPAQKTPAERPAAQTTPAERPAAQTTPASAPPAQAPSPPTQTRVQAKPGETCLAYFKGCIDWCTKNMSGSTDCLNYCKEQFGTCQTKGEWSMDNNTKVIYGMPPK